MHPPLRELIRIDDTTDRVIGQHSARVRATSPKNVVGSIDAAIVVVIACQSGRIKWRGIKRYCIEVDLQIDDRVDHICLIAIDQANPQRLAKLWVRFANDEFHDTGFKQTVTRRQRIVVRGDHVSAGQQFDTVAGKPRKSKNPNPAYGCTALLPDAMFPIATVSV